MTKTGKNILIGALCLAIIAAVGYSMATMPDERSAGEHLSDAVNKLDEGVDDAARELQDRTPLERAEDEYEDATDGNAE